MVSVGRSVIIAGEHYQGRIVTRQPKDVPCKFQLGSVSSSRAVKRISFRCAVAFDQRCVNEDYQCTYLLVGLIIDTIPGPECNLDRRRRWRNHCKHNKTL